MATNEHLVNSIIGSGSSLEGDLRVEGLLRVDGSVKGSVRCTGKVVVGSSGRCQAPIRASSAIIGGIVKGDVCVTDRLVILKGGMIVGNVFAPRLEADEGVVIHGYVKISLDPATAEVEARRFIQARCDLRLLDPEPPSQSSEGSAPLSSAGGSEAAANHEATVAREAVADHEAVVTCEAVADSEAVADREAVAGPGLRRVTWR